MNAKTLKETLFYLVPILSLVACGPSDPPVASLQVGPDELQLPFPGVVDLELSWAMELPLDGFEGQPLVFVHAIRIHLIRVLKFGGLPYIRTPIRNTLAAVFNAM